MHSIWRGERDQIKFSGLFSEECLCSEAGVLSLSLPFSFFFFFFKFYLFIYLWLCWVFVSARGLSLVAASGGHSSSRCAGLSVTRPLLLWSTGSRRAGSAIVAHGPSCTAACGIFPDQGSNPCPLHWQADSQPLRHQGSPSPSVFLLIKSPRETVESHVPTEVLAEWKDEAALTESVWAQEDASPPWRSRCHHLQGFSLPSLQP